MKTLLIVLLVLIVPAERPKAEGIFLPMEQTCVPMLDAYRTIERWPAYGGVRR